MPHLFFIASFTSSFLVNVVNLVDLVDLVDLVSAFQPILR